MLVLASLALAPSPAAACDPATDPSCYDDPFYGNNDAGDPYDDGTYYYDDTYYDDGTYPDDTYYYDDTYYAGTYPDDTYHDDDTYAGTYPDDTYHDDGTPPPTTNRVTSPTSAAVRSSGSTPVNSTASNWSYSRSDAVDAMAPSPLPSEPNGTGEVTDTTDTSLQRSIAGRLVLATDALAELGAFSRDEDPLVSQTIADLARTVPSAGLADDGYRRELASLTQEFPTLVAELDTEPSDALLEVLDVLDGDAISRLEAGDMGFVEPLPWLDAIADVLRRGGGQLVIESEAALDADDRAVLDFVSLFADPEIFVVEDRPPARAESTTVSAAPNLALVDPTVEEPVPVGEEPADDATSPGLLLGILAAVVAAAALATFWFTRRTSDTDDVDRPDADVGTPSGAPSPATVATLPIAPKREEPGSLIELLDASRRMTASLDTREIASIAVTEARNLVDAEGGMLLRRSAGVIVPAAAEPSALFCSDDLESSILRRVVDTGQAQSSVTSEDPALVDVPAAMASVAIVASGSVIGALMVVRRPSRPFRADEVDALETLAPLVGSALLAAETHDSATALADLDALTGLANRRCLDRDIAALRPSHIASYVMIDVDHFKNFNDTNGHAAGDVALQTVARAIEANVRPEDRVYRYGGEEFCVLLPGASSADAALVAERVRSAVEASTIPGAEHQPGGHVTISIGVADTEAGIADIIARADGALYQAKETGRNRVNIAGAPTD